MMNLEEELVLTQFGQGVRSATDLLDLFAQLDARQQQKQFVHLYDQVSKAELVEADIEQAASACSFDVTDALYAYLKPYGLTTGPKKVIHIPNTANPPEGRLDKPYELLLHLFKLDYQRRFTYEKGNPDNWRYWDLSDADVAQSILTKHRELVDEIYNAASFRSEFVSIAKLWHTNTRLTNAHPQDTTTRKQAMFLSYDAMLDQSIQFNKNHYSIALLRHSLSTALTIRYKLNGEQTARLVFAVLDRHLQESYGSGL